MKVWYRGEPATLISLNGDDAVIRVEGYECSNTVPRWDITPSPAVVASPEQNTEGHGGRDTSLATPAVELLPCPFCGGSAKVRIQRVAEDCEAAFVQCGSCDARTEGMEGPYADSVYAASEWNTRPSPAGLGAKSERERFAAGGWNIGSIEEACAEMDELSGLARVEAARRISAERSEAAHSPAPPRTETDGVTEEEVSVYAAALLASRRSGGDTGTETAGVSEARRIITNAAGYYFGGELVPFDEGLKRLALEALGGVAGENPARIPSDADHEDAVKAGMVRRMNVLHASLSEIMDAIASDPFRSQMRFTLAQPEGTFLDGSPTYERITFGMLKRAQHALSEAAYAGPRLTPVVAQLVVNCGDEIHARRMGEPSAQPEEAFAELLLALRGASGEVSARERQGPSFSPGADTAPRHPSDAAELRNAAWAVYDFAENRGSWDSDDEGTIWSLGLMERDAWDALTDRLGDVLRSEATPDPAVADSAALSQGGHGEPEDHTTSRRLRDTPERRPSSERGGV